MSLLVMRIQRRFAGSSRWFGALLLAAWLACGPVFNALAASVAPAPATITMANTPRWENQADMSFQHWGTGQGIVHDIVTSIAEDGDGFIWLGTQGGLARWDGYRFRNFQPNPKQAGGLPDGFIETLHNDKRRRLWIGTSSAGLAMYDPVREQFVRYGAGAQGLSHVAVRSIVDDGADGLWIGTDGGLDHLSFASGKVQQVLAEPMVTALLLDRQRNFWIGTRKKLLRRAAGSSQWETVALPLDDQSPNISVLMQDQQGVIWLGTKRHGAYFLLPGSQQFQPVQEHGEDERGGPLLMRDWVTQIVALGPQQVWISTFGNGILHYDRQLQITRRIKHNPLLADSLAHNTVMAMLRDRSGLLWLGNHRGLSRYDPRPSGVFSLIGVDKRVDGVSDVDVRSVLETRQGLVWLGLGNNGVDIFDPRRGRVGGLRIDTSHPASALQAGRVQALAQDASGQVFIGSDRGLYQADPDGSHLQRIVLTGLGTELQVRTLYFDGSHLLLGLFNGGLWQYQPGDKGRSASLVQPAGFADLTDQRVDVVLRDAPGSLWVGTRNGLNRVVPGQATQKIFPDPSNPQALPAGLISTLLMDQKGRLWVGTQGGGIAVLRGPGNKPQFQRIGLAEGLANMNIDQLLLDQSGRIWASTDAGIASIDADTLKVTMQRTADGVRIPSYWGGAGVSSSNGELLFGGAGGLTVIQPALRQAWQYQPPVLITDVRIKGKPVNAGALNLPLPDLAPFTIEPDANSIAVEFAALDYSAPELNRYAYRMDGYDADWIETDASRRIVSYTNLAPGNYRLRLRGSNRNGQWSEPERVLPLRVLPAWYQTWAWYGFCMVSTLLLLWQLFRSRTRFMRRRQYELERQIEQHTRQLREQHAELLQQAKLASLGTLTAGVAHEINNPANFALVGSYNLAQQLAQFHDVLLQLAGDEATPDFIDLLDQRFAALNGSLAAISEGTERIRDLVKDLRTFSRLEESNVKSVVLTDSLRATINLVRTQYAEGMRIECDLQANPELECSPVQLNQVFMNLMVNAWQAISIRSPEQQAAQAGCLAIRSYLESDFLVFEFEDNGVGIPEQSLPHIFDPFFTTKGVGQGMGMGLSVAFGIMEQHHGSISVRSELGKGTCFTLRLPVANSQPDGNSK